MGVFLVYIKEKLNPKNVVFGFEGPGVPSSYGEGPIVRFPSILRSLAARKYSKVKVLRI